MKKTLIILFLLFSIGGYAQVFPVQVNARLVPPYSPYLSDYTTPGVQNFMVQVRANDLALSGYPFKLRITIEGVGISLRTKQNLTPSPLILEGSGITQILYGEDLQEYFHPDALDFAGFTRSDYERSARLPEGVYRFTVEVLDYNRGTVVSNKGIAMAWVILNDPPLLNLPANLSKLKVRDPVNILFHWTPRHSGSPNAAFTTEYIFRMVEIWPEDRNPYDALITQPPIYETITTQNQIVYGLSEPALTGGRKYAWQVEARDTGGKDLFKNKGRSEVFVFRFGDALAIPENLQLRWAKPTTLAIRWGAVKVADTEEVKYRLAYRLRKRTPDHRWYETRTKFTDKTLYDLQPNTEYEFKVRTETAAQEGEYSEIQVFKTLAQEKDAFVCRDAGPPPLPENTLPVFPLGINDTIRAGGYDVLVRDVIEVEGKYFGSGFAIVPWFNSAKVRVTFESIRVNDRFWLTSGIIKSVWNGESPFLIEEQKPILPGSAPQAGELDVTIVSSDSLITIEGAVQGTAIATVTKDEEGNIVITTTDGGEQTLDRGVSYAIVDDVGSGYVVDKAGNIAKTTSTEARATAARGDRDYNLGVRFARGHGRYGFDEKKFEALARYYQQLEGGLYAGWKALSSSAPDAIDGHLRSGDTDIRSVRFEAGAVPITPVSAAGGKVTLNVQGRAAGLEEELLALYKPADSLPGKVVGKINLVTYDPIRYNLVIVPVNDASIPGGLSAYVISGSLNNVFNQAVVEWKVSIPDRIRVALGETFDGGETGVFSNYTDDMKKVLTAWGRFEENTYYLFLIDEPRNMATLGYMPRGRQAGFVFVAPHQGNTEEFLKTLAHELGHGAFNLKHTFSEHKLPANTTDNLMDYSSGTALYKYQWDHIHQPQGVMGLFEGSEGGMVVNAESPSYDEVKLLFEDSQFKQWVQKVRRIYEFLKGCDNEGWQSYRGMGIIPHCFWRDQNVPSGLHYSNADLPFIAGLVDGAYSEGEGFYHLTELVQDLTKYPAKAIYAYSIAHWECKTEKLVENLNDYEYVIAQLAAMEKEHSLWNWVKEQWYNYKGQKEKIEKYFNDCKDADDLREIVDELYELTTNWEEIKSLSEDIYDNLNIYWNTLSAADNDGRYQRGLLIVPAATIIFPIGVASKLEKTKDALKFLKEGSNETWNNLIVQIARSVSATTPNAYKLSAKLKAIYDDCIKAGYKAYDEGIEIHFLAADDRAIAKISEGALQIRIPESHGIWAIQSNSIYAINALYKVKNGSPLYRIGTLNRSSAAEAQYWSLENPLDIKGIKTFSQKYGIPEENLKSGEFFVEVGKPKKNIPIVTREAPGFGINSGGSIEIVIPESSIELESFHTISLYD